MARRFCIQPVAGRHTQQYPELLAHGEPTSFFVSFEIAPNWPKEFLSGVLQDMSKKNLNTLRAMVNTLVGPAIEAMFGKDILERLRAACCGLELRGQLRRRSYQSALPS